jgi:hypothetical protein
LRLDPLHEMSAPPSFFNDDLTATSSNIAYYGTYSADADQPIRGTKAAPAALPIDDRTILKTHFDELNSFLEGYVAKGKCVCHF